MTRRIANVIWLGISCVLMGMVAIELAGINLPGFEPISTAAQHNPVVRVAVLVLFLGSAIWWWFFHTRRK